MATLRIGLMGLGHVGRQIYRLALASERSELVAVSDIGQPDILHHLLRKSMPRDEPVALEGNYLVAEGNGSTQRTRLMAAEKPAEIPWDLLGVDVVIDATGRFRTRAKLAPHLDNGARRVLLSTLPDDEVDRVILVGVNEDEAVSEDRIVSAGSASTTAMALALRVLAEAGPIAHATMTSVHAYTGDQSLQDHAGPGLPSKPCRRREHHPQRDPGAGVGGTGAAGGSGPLERLRAQRSGGRRVDARFDGGVPRAGAGRGHNQRPVRRLPRPPSLNALP